MKNSYTETIAFDDVELAGELFGPLNANVELIADASGAEIQTKGMELSITSSSPQKNSLILNLFTQIYGLLQKGHKIQGQDILHGYEALLQNNHAELNHVFSQATIVVGPRKSIQARNPSQVQFVELLRSHDMVFVTGPAGTGKTYLAVAMAISMLNAKRVKKIILTRPAVEAGEKLGFLPGDMVDKVNPYLRPLYDALNDMLGSQVFQQKQEQGIIEVAPLAFMRGRTLNDSFLILDEAQNTTCEQMKMFLTRMGFGSRVVVTGDITQIDLPLISYGRLAGDEKMEKERRSGLVHALHVLEKVPGIGFHNFKNKDVVRHPLVGRIVEAYDTYEKK